MKFALYHSFVICLLFAFVSNTVQAQKKIQQRVPEKTRILFLLDGSGSMLEPWTKPTLSKINAAKNILGQIVDSLKQNTKLELALRVYGHRYPRESNNCQDTYLEVPFKPNNHKMIIDKINEIKPKGVTPITYSLEQAAKDFPASPGYRNIIILITDGIESCKGDPCATSRELQKKGVFLRPYIIGLGMRAEKALDCAGKFIDANTPKEFHDVLNHAIEASFAKTTVSIELLDATGKPTESNVNVTFINTFTGAPMYDFIHYLDKQGKPDSVQVDPVVDYDVVVHTIPPVEKKNVNLTLGKHNVIQVSVPQGNISFKQQDRKDNTVEAIVRKKGSSGTINVQHNNETVRYLTGWYEVETLTLPRRIFPIEVQANKTQSILLPPPSVVNFNTITTGYGSLYEMKENGQQEWVCNLNDMKPQFSLNLLPGSYKIVFRAKNTTGSKYTGFKVFKVSAGQTSSVNVFN
jgi:Ca-activated chloride channel family protein